GAIEHRERLVDAAPHRLQRNDAGLRHISPKRGRKPQQAAGEPLKPYLGFEAIGRQQVEAPRQGGALRRRGLEAIDGTVWRQAANIDRPGELGSVGRCGIGHRNASRGANATVPAVSAATGWAASAAAWRPT